MKNKKHLKDVTLLAISSIEIPATIKALEISSMKLGFASIKLLSHKNSDLLPPNMLWEKVPEINDIMEFNDYMFFNMGKHINTSHALIVQYHAYVTSPELWDDGWLDYDYIGAPWAIRAGSYIADNGERVRVGNGGFTLRSKKLLDAPKKLLLKLKQEQGYWNEDGNICCYHRTAMLGYGIKYAPIDVAARFSYENPMPENHGVPSFGFHKFRNPANS